MDSESRRLAGILLIVLPTVIVGGVSILTLLVNDLAYADNAFRQDLWRAGHAHAGVLPVLALGLVVLGIGPTPPDTPKPASLPM